MKLRDTFGWGACVVALFVWGVTFASTRVLLEEFSALEINIVRFALSWAVLACATMVGRAHADALRNASEPWWFFAAMGFFGIFAYQFLENCAIYYTNASNVAILVSFGPVVTAIMARIASNERSLSPGFILGAFIAVVGVTLVAFNDVVNFQLRPLGDLMALGAMACWGIYSIFVDRANKRGVHSLVALRKSFGWSLFMMIPLAIWGTTDAGYVTLDGSYSVTLDIESNKERFCAVSNLANLVFLGILASAVAFVLWSCACKTLGVVRATVMLYLTPIVGTIFAAVFLDEHLTWISVCGGTLILLGVVIASKKQGGRK